MLRTKYEEYIASSEWARKRRARLALDGHKCRMCDEDGMRFQLEVHHRPSSYRRIPNESVQDDLITICACCHELITAAIRGDRYGQRALPKIEVITENAHVRMEIDHGMANTAIHIDIIGPAVNAQRTISEPAKPIRPGIEEGFEQAQQDRGRS
jgi:hypothetical protein